MIQPILLKKRFGHDAGSIWVFVREAVNTMGLILYVRRLKGKRLYRKYGSLFTRIEDPLVVSILLKRLSK